MSSPIPNSLPEILFISSFPPRECGIATYTQDLIAALTKKFEHSFQLIVAALELQAEKHHYPEEVRYIIETDNPASYSQFTFEVNANKALQLVVVQHEFGLFNGHETEFIQLLKQIHQPIAVAFHTVLPSPNEELKNLVHQIDAEVQEFIVMTQTSAKILESVYNIEACKINIIAHGTHLVEHLDPVLLKEKYNFTGRKVLSTFGLLSSGKCIETTIDALRLIVKRFPDILFLVIGKTHPNIIKDEGEKYRNELVRQINELQLQYNVKFINQYLPLNELLEYLQLTDIYLFTTKDRNQAVSGTFSYALSCGCPIISTPIPHAVEVLKNQTGVIIDFENPKQVARKVIELLGDEELCHRISSNGIHRLAPTAWENSAIAHGILFEKMVENEIILHYKLPPINLNHIKKMTTDFGMIQFAIINQPDKSSGYTLDDNARALIALCKHFEITKDQEDIPYIKKYYEFIVFCLQPDSNFEGIFLNYVAIDKSFSNQNKQTNLADSNGRAIWALGYLISLENIVPESLIDNAKGTMNLALSNVLYIHSPRSIAFIIKGIYYSNKTTKSASNLLLMKHLTDKLVHMFKHESEEKWQWFESYLTYGNSLLPEAMLCAYLTFGSALYKEIALVSFYFLLSKIFTDDSIKVISNNGWLYKGDSHEITLGGEQPIDVAYTIMALEKFYLVFHEESYLVKMEIAFNWFLGQNHLNRIIYNPCTGGCYDGLETDYINLNQGAESTISYLMARLTIEKHHRIDSLKQAKLKARYFQKNKKHQKQPIYLN